MDWGTFHLVILEDQISWPEWETFLNLLKSAYNGLTYWSADAEAVAAFRVNNAVVLHSQLFILLMCGRF